MTASGATCLACSGRPAPSARSPARPCSRSIRRGATPMESTLQSVPGSPGLFSADFLADRIGKFQIAVPSPANPSAKATTSFLVQSIALEKQQPEMNEALLKKIAAAGGGAYYHPDEAR